MIEFVNPRKEKPSPVSHGASSGEGKNRVGLALRKRMEKQALIELAKQKAAEHGLVPSLVCAVCEQESGWNPFAVRYEPGFMSKYVAPIYTKGGMSATEAYSRSISWGLMQVMGQVAREDGFGGPFLSELCEPAVGLDAGCKRLRKMVDRHPDDVGSALQAWNGGANQNYAAEVLARLPTYAEPEPVKVTAQQA
jgi:soluble lytic murein transglycosylase-like protein